jgi:tRNA U34 5-carboxymethylaminomethyl modifying GTPase MnmE/TrmE
VTTRLVIGGWDIDLIDTAGLRAPGEATSPTERAGIERAMAAAATADLIVDVRPIGWVQESQPFCLGTPRITVISQGDLAPAVVAPPGALLTSALTGQGIESLAHAIVAAVVPEEANDPALLAGPMPFMPRQVTDVRLV